MPSPSKPKARPSSARSEDGKLRLLLSTERQDALRLAVANFDRMVAHPVLRSSSWEQAQRELQHRLEIARLIHLDLVSALRGYTAEVLNREAKDVFQKTLARSGEPQTSWKTPVAEQSRSIQHMLIKAQLSRSQALQSLDSPPVSEAFAATTSALIEADIVNTILVAALTSPHVVKSEEVILRLSELGLMLAARSLVASQGWAESLREEPLADKLVKALMETLRQAPPGIHEAFVSPDGTSFRLVGPSWTPELSIFGGETTLRLQRTIAPSGHPYIHGGFASPFEPPPSWSRLSREDA